MSCSPPPPRSSTSTTPASTSTTSPPSPPGCCASHPGWLTDRLAELDAGDIPALLAAGRNLKFTVSLARERDRQLGYFQVNAHRMHYAHFRDLGMFVGSGAVEASCKAIIGQRL